MATITMRTTTMATCLAAYRTRFLTGAVCAALSLAAVPAANASVDVVNTSHIHDSASLSTHCQDNATTSTPQSQTRSQLDCMLKTARHYQQKDHRAQQRYFAYKAQAWLNYAIHEDSKNSRTPAQYHATQAAETILQALKDGTDTDLNLTPDIPTMSALMRPDLWATLNALKDNDGIAFAPSQLAFSEVALIWAAADQCNRHPKQAATNFRLAERWLEYAREAYINAHDSQTNVALENAINRYYQTYAPLDTGDDVCHGQTLPVLTEKSNTKPKTDSNVETTATITLPMPLVTYHIGD